MASPWTVARKERVKELWTDHSATQIAALLSEDGFTPTRNSVIGILHRASITQAVKKESRVFGSKPVREKRSSNNHHATVTLIVRMNSHDRIMETRMAAEEVKLRCVEILPQRVSLMDLADDGCRYPFDGVGDEASIVFCNHPQRKDSSYCTPHFWLCRGEGSYSERDAHRVSRRVAAA